MRLMWRMFGGAGAHTTTPISNAHHSPRQRHVGLLYHPHRQHRAPLRPSRAILGSQISATFGSDHPRGATYPPLGVQGGGVRVLVVKAPKSAGRSSRHSHVTSLPIHGSNFRELGGGASGMLPGGLCDSER